MFYIIEKANTTTLLKTSMRVNNIIQPNLDNNKKYGLNKTTVEILI